MVCHDCKFCSKQQDYLSITGNVSDGCGASKYAFSYLNETLSFIARLAADEEPHYLFTGTITCTRHKSQTSGKYQLSDICAICFARDDAELTMSVSIQWFPRRLVMRQTRRRLMKFRNSGIGWQKLEWQWCWGVCQILEHSHNPLFWLTKGAVVSLIIGNSTVYSTDYSGYQQGKHQSLTSLVRCEEFGDRKTSNVESVSMSWRHHDWIDMTLRYCDFIRPYCLGPPLVIWFDLNPRLNG